MTLTYAEIIERAKEISESITHVVQENEQTRRELFDRTRQRAAEQIRVVFHQGTGTDED